MSESNNPKNWTPSWQSFLATGNPSNIVSSPTVASAIGTKIDAVNGQSVGQQIVGATLDQTTVLLSAAQNTWSPVLSFGGANTGQSASLVTCYYAVVFGVCFLQGSIRLSNKGTSTGAASITGLPVTALGGFEYPLHTLSSDVASSSGQPPCCTILNDTIVVYRGLPTSDGSNVATDADFTNSSVLNFYGSFLLEPT